MKLTLITFISLLNFSPMLMAEDASYMVPAGAFLDVDVHVPMQKAKFSLKKGKAKLDYALPKLIDGPNPHRFKLNAEGTDFPIELTGNGVVGTCSKLESGEVNCVMKYDKNEEGTFALDLEGASKLIEADPTLSEADKALLKQAGISLSHEALGIITIK